MFSLRDSPLWFYKIFTLKNLQTIYPSNSYNLFREVAFSIRAGYFLFSSRLFSLFEQSIFTLQHYQIPQEKTQEQAKPTAILQASPQPSYKQAHNHPTSKAHNHPTSKSPQPSTNKAHNLSINKTHNHPTSKSSQPHHTPNAQKNTQKNKQIQQNIPNILPFNIFLK